MSTWDRSQLRPQYPVFSEQGMVAEPYPNGPPDLRPSGFGPGYSVYASAHGRNLAGMDESNFDSVHSEGIETYPNELNLLSIADDVDGNGMFDPHGSHGNIHPDAGIFQDHANLPGYVARDKFYEMSEVRDLTKPDGYVMYVPGGAVSFQQGQPETFEQNELLWEIPGVGYEYDPVEDDSTINAPTATWAIGASEPSKNTQYMFLAAGAGLAVGLAVVLMQKKRKR